MSGWLNSPKLESLNDACKHYEVIWSTGSVLEFHPYLHSLSMTKLKYKIEVVSCFF